MESISLTWRSNALISRHRAMTATSSLGKSMDILRVAAAGNQSERLNIEIVLLLMPICPTRGGKRLFRKFISDLNGVESNVDKFLSYPISSSSSLLAGFFFSSL